MVRNKNFRYFNRFLAKTLAATTALQKFTRGAVFKGIQDYCRVLDTGIGSDNSSLISWISLSRSNPKSSIMMVPVESLSTLGNSGMFLFQMIQDQVLLFDLL